jgi:hypothetical protein
MFPKGKSLFLVKKDGAMTPNFIMIQSLNISMALELPIPGMEQFRLKDVPNYGKIWVDNQPLKITVERFQNDVSLWVGGKCYDWQYFDRVVKGTAENFTIPLGAKTTLLLRLKEDLTSLMEIGDHTFKVAIDFHGFTINVDVTLDLTAENTNITFDPSNT